MDTLAEIIHEDVEDGNQKSTIISRLAPVISGGNSVKYFGKHYSLESLETLELEELQKLHSRYEAKFGHEMIKSLGLTTITIFVNALGYGFAGINAKINDVEALSKELENDPLVSNSLSHFLCKLNYKFGVFLGPLAAGLIIAKHVSFKNNSDTNINEPSGISSEPSGGGTTTSETTNT